MYGLDFGMGAGESRGGKVCGILGKVRYAMWNLLWRSCLVVAWLFGCCEAA